MSNSKWNAGILKILSNMQLMKLIIEMITKITLEPQ